MQRSIVLSIADSRSISVLDIYWNILRTHRFLIWLLMIGGVKYWCFYVML